ncbi:flippase [Geobacillus kaustophilus NBRC 102445]|uniref:flippase n=1 Tax=Geobacillus thermoleovorans group TaxID=1505648 RepID=UPI0005A86BB9|nr:flippase [Geobacillus kaustophilus]MED4972300.1 flippase [Geobacillus thermoleovorans]QCK81223.1 flippase [Geobacillus kaustophilus NBRC 102445]
MILKEIVNDKFFLKIMESFIGRASFVLFNMLFTLVCTRIYGPEIFGEYTYAFTLVTFLMIFAIAGLDNGLIYYIPKVENKFVSLSIVVNFIFSIVLILCSYFFVKDSFTQLMLPLVWLVSLEQIFFGIYRATGRIKKYYYINGFASISLRIVVIVVFHFLFGANVMNIAIAVYLSFIFSNLLYFYQNKEWFGKIEFDKEFLKYSFLLVLVAVMGVVMDRIDILMIGNMMTNKDVGIYQVSSQIANLVSVLLVIFNTVFAPQISKFYHSGKLDELRRLYVQSTRLLGLGALIFVIFLSTFSEYILMVFGKEFVEGQTALILRGIGQFINAAVGSVWLMLAMTGKPKLQMYGNFAACIINVILNYILIPKYGIDGAAFASMVAVGFVNILGYILVRREFKVKVYGIV